MQPEVVEKLPPAEEWEFVEKPLRSEWWEFLVPLSAVRMRVMLQPAAQAARRAAEETAGRS